VYDQPVSELSRQLIVLRSGQTNPSSGWFPHPTSAADQGAMLDR
jgi:hypothetical protein